MNIRIDKTYWLTSDTYCFKIVQRKKKDGPITRGYYMNLPAALEGYCNMKLLNSSASSFDGVARKLKELTAKMEEIRQVLNV
ncbi:MAG: hypothetical protein JRJ78_14715 [Deltaproteobacteria bacterium]|nr:hypothetical protein [Deltaproteobacteria bacterium]